MKTTQTIWRWEQDGAGGDHGMATYFPGAAYEITVRLDSFKEADALYNAISEARMATTLSTRADLAAQIRRVLP